MGLVENNSNSLSNWLNSKELVQNSWELSVGLAENSNSISNRKLNLRMVFQLCHRLVGIDGVAFFRRWKLSPKPLKSSLPKNRSDVERRDKDAKKKPKRRRGSS